MYAASREALGHVRAALDTALAAAPAGGATAVAATVGSELFSVVETLDGERSLRGLLADASTDPQARRQLATRLLEGKVTAETLATVVDAVGQQWSQPSDLADALELLGRESLLRAAADQQQLDTVEDELFRLGRIVAGDTELEKVLSDRTAAVGRKQQLLAKLLYGKVTAITESLATQAIGRLRGTPAGTFDQLSNLAAAQREQTVAHVRSAQALTGEQFTKLTDTLTRIYGRPVTVHVEVDRDLLGGLVIRIGDEVIDGSATGRLAAVRKALG
ncbi:F0F1 ATP synthase subunit delta [Speluncibacter jeojiensis]|uniref:ATP synthase subunit delta n=1 Tax=Speluncibacter jeojiensis TaxID=2710754 RepID=A0A9X4M835_9ACTN|nr:F0F1 ATP synthase subunit delta [Rhodococcus sp. D2-41]MDG3017043.1 F0F1 ATP synthase subunit delta [Corynebacteriales bacterium D3-21]